MAHEGLIYEAEMAVFTLEDAVNTRSNPRISKLSDTHQMLMDEHNFQPGHFDRLVVLVQDRADAVRIAEHPNCTEQLKQELLAKWPE